MPYNPYGMKQDSPYGGGAPRRPAPSYPGAGQTGRGYGSPNGGIAGVASGQKPKIMDPWGGMGNPPGVMGWQTPAGGGQSAGYVNMPQAHSVGQQYAQPAQLPPPSMMDPESRAIYQQMQQAQPHPMFGAMNTITQMYGGQSPQGDPLMQQQLQRQRQLQLQHQLQQQQMQMFGGPYGQSMTQPFPATNPWQSPVPRNFNQGANYAPFTRRW